jgi:TolB protein
MSPAWNRKTGAQITVVAAPGCRSTPWKPTAPMCSGSPIRPRLPAWSPNGQFLVVSWMRKYGPGAPGAQDIYIMDIASKQWVQLTHDGGRNDFPYWSPDGRHIIFQSSRAGSLQIWTMLADGTNQKQLTFAGANTQPNWSWK